MANAQVDASHNKSLIINRFENVGLFNKGKRIIVDMVKYSVR